MAELVNSYIEAFSSRQASASQYQAILEAAVPLGLELAAAGAWSNLAAIAVQEGRPDEALPLLKLAETVWRSWGDAAGLMVADYWTGRIDVASGKLEAALRAYQRAASASAGVPEMSRFHQDAVTEVAGVQRSLGRGERVTFEQWWPQFQAAAARHDAKTVAAGVKFPLSWENGPVREIRTEAEFVRRFDHYFNGEIRKMIGGRKPERLGNGRYIITWKARGNEYSLYFRPGGPAGFVLDGLSEGPS
jgi:tetratricopeptide (TPR) repeat protein